MFHIVCLYPSIYFYDVTDANMDVLNREDTVRDVLDVLNVHKYNNKVVHNACLALAAMVEPEGMWPYNPRHYNEYNFN